MDGTLGYRRRLQIGASCWQWWRHLGGLLCFWTFWCQGIIGWWSFKTLRPSGDIATAIWFRFIDYVIALWPMTVRRRGVCSHTIYAMPIGDPSISGDNPISGGNMGQCVGHGERGAVGRLSLRNFRFLFDELHPPWCHRLHRHYGSFWNSGKTHEHYSDVMASHITGNLFVQQHVTTKEKHYWFFLGFTGNRRIPLTKDQQCGKRFHVIVSWIIFTHWLSHVRLLADFLVT